MKRPLLVVATGYIIGIVWGLYCNCSIALLYAVFTMFWLIYKLIQKPRKKLKLFSFKRYFRYIKIYLNFKVIITIIITSLISNFIIINQNKKYQNLYTDVSNLKLIGTIVSNEKVKENINIYKLKVDELNESLKYKNTYLFIQVKNNLNLEYGSKVEINGEFVEPNIQRNYKGFDYKEFLKTKKIYGTVKVKKIKIIEKNSYNFISIFSNKVFLKIKSNIEKSMPKETSQLVLGIMLGYTEAMDEEVIQNFRDSNMAHILAVSGMHVTYIVIGTIIILKPILGKRKSKILVILLLTGYMLITGFTPSIVRATIMHIIMLSSGLLYRKNDVLNSIAVSILIILIYNPFLISSISVLLSYGGTIGIINFNKTILYVLKKIKIKNKKYKYRINKKFAKAIKFIRESLSLAISVQLMIIPIIAKYFNTFGFAFCITNILLSVIIGPIIAIGLIIIICSLISTNLAEIISFFLIPFLKFLTIVSEIGKNIPVSKIYIGTPHIIEIIIYYFFIFIQNFIFKIYMAKNPSTFQYRVRNIISLIKYKIRLNKNKVILLIFIVCMIFRINLFFSQNLKIFFIDVGQGDSTLIITPMKHSILIDGGGSLNESFDVGKNTVLPYLLSRRITKLDHIIVSHFDQDHIGGLLTVMTEIKVDKVVISKQLETDENYEKFINIVKENRIKVVVVEQGDKLNIEKNLYFDILWPNNLKFTSENVLNNNSIVCKMHYKDFSMLFTGDIEEFAEKQILQEYKNNLNILNSTILKVAHHGSKTSSIQEFIEVVKPEIALIGVGKNNIFGHPNDEVLKRFKNMRFKGMQNRFDGGNRGNSR